MDQTVDVLQACCLMFLHDFKNLNAVMFPWWLKGSMDSVIDYKTTNFFFAWLWGVINEWFSLIKAAKHSLNFIRALNYALPPFHFLRSSQEREFMKKRFLWFFLLITLLLLYLTSPLRRIREHGEKLILPSFADFCLSESLTHSCPLCRVARRAALPIWEHRYLGQFSMSQFRAQRFPHYFSWDIYFDKEG